MAVLSVREILEAGDYIITYSYNSKNNIGQVHISWTKETYVIKYDNGKLANNFTNEIIDCEEKYAKAYAYIILNKICKKYDFPFKFVKFLEDNKLTKYMSFRDESADNDFFYLAKDLYDDGPKPTHYELSKLRGLERPMKNIINYYMGITNE